MSSDGKGNRKLRRPKCPKCSDRGYVFAFDRVRGRMAGPARLVRCVKCVAGKDWNGKP